MLWRLFRLFLIWLFNALESSGLRSSKLQSNSPDTDMTAPQLSNSPQYYSMLAENIWNVWKPYIWCRKHRDKHSVIEELVAVFYYHVCSANEIEIMPL